jgi:uncharacterized paraquat-inducible protein A
VKEVIELLEKALKEIEYYKGGVTHCYAKPLHFYKACKLVRKSIARLKEPYQRNNGKERRVQCNWCESVFYEDYVRVDEDEDEEQCPVCGEKGYLMDTPKQEEKPR